MTTKEKALSVYGADAELYHWGQDVRTIGTMSDYEEDKETWQCADQADEVAVESLRNDPSRPVDSPIDKTASDYEEEYALALDDCEGDAILIDDWSLDGWDSDNWNPGAVIMYNEGV